MHGWKAESNRSKFRGLMGIGYINRPFALRGHVTSFFMKMKVI